MRLHAACHLSPASELRLDVTMGVGCPVSAACDGWPTADGSRAAHGGGCGLELRIGPPTVCNVDQ
eukprot:scaffold51005_cov63-Phaeocystis_antarctica.AAC.3